MITIAQVGVIFLGKKKVVDEGEVVRILSSIARGEGEGAKVSEQLKAVELLAKKYDLFSAKEPSGSDVKMVIDYVGGRKGEV